MNLDDSKRPERVWIKAKLRAVLAKQRVGLLPAAVDALVDEVWSICQDERAVSVLLMLTMWEHYQPITDHKMQSLARVIELREEHAPRKCRIGGEDFALAPRVRK